MVVNISHPIIGAIVGVFAGALAILLIESAGHALFGTAAPGDLASVTVPMFLSVLVAWVVGAGVAGLVATTWSRGRSLGPGLAGGLVLVAGAGLTMMLIPHPIWMVLAALTLMPASAWIAARSRLRRA